MMAADMRRFRDTRRVPGLRRRWDQQQSAVHGDLVYWGRRYQKILISEGYSPFSPFAGILEGRVGAFGSRVLIPDMSQRAWEINVRVWALPTDLAWALCGRYALPPSANGQLFTPAAIAEALGCSEDAYYKRVSIGRERLRRQIFSG